MTTFSTLGAGATLVIPDDAYTASLLSFVATTALADFTSVGFDGGARIVRTARPLAICSTGERALWALLTDLVAGDLRRILEQADPDVLAALADVFGQAPGVAGTPTRVMLGIGAYDARQVPLGDAS